LNPWPLTPKDKEIGKFLMEDNIDATSAARKLIIASGIPEAEADDWLEHVRESIIDTNVHTYVHL
jgi:hypothetical protein